VGGLAYNSDKLCLFAASVALPVSQLDPRNLEPVGVYLFHAEQSAQRSTFWPDTKWVRVIDSNLKNASDQNASRSFNRHPEYVSKLWSAVKTGSEVAIHDIEGKLGTVAASIKELTRSY